MKSKFSKYAERDGAFTRQSLRSHATSKAKRRRNKATRKEGKIMKQFLSVLILVCGSLATEVPVQEAKLMLYPITVIVNHDTNSEVHIRQNGIYWMVSHFQGEHVAVGTNETRRAAWYSATLWDGNPGHEMRELSDLNNQIRFLKIGTDSVALVIVDTDSTYIYKRLATTSTAPEVWNRTAFAGTFDTLLYASYSNGVLTHNYPNSSGWSVANGELVKAESTFTFSSIILYGRPEADLKGNLWTYGYKQGTIVDTVLTKYERLTRRGFYYSAGRGDARFLERSLSKAFIGRNGAIDSCYIGSKPYITPRQIYYSVVTDVVTGRSVVDSIVAVVDDVAPNLWGLNNQDFWGNNVLSQIQINPASQDSNHLYSGFGYIPTTSQYTSTRYRRYDWQSIAVRNGSADPKDTSWTMTDTIQTNWIVLSDSMKVVSPIDTAIYDTTHYSKSITVTNSVWLKIKSAKLPTWLTMQDNGEDTSIVFAEAEGWREYQKSLHTFTLSGVPGAGHYTGETDTVKIVFIDTLTNWRTGQLHSCFQTCSLSYQITLTSTGTSVKATASSQKLANLKPIVKTFNLLGRSAKQTTSAVVIRQAVNSKIRKLSVLIH
jgi:hypothetical protein